MAGERDPEMRGEYIQLKNPGANGSKEEERRMVLGENYCRTMKKVNDRGSG